MKTGFAIVPLIAGLAVAVLSVPVPSHGAEIAGGEQSPQMERPEQKRMGAGEAQKAAQSLKNEIQRCWAIPVAVQAAKSKKKPVVTIAIDLDRQGRIIGSPRAIDSNFQLRKSNNNKEMKLKGLLKPLAESAIRAVTQCQPYSIAKNFPEYYDSWQKVTIRFDPSEL